MRDFFVTSGLEISTNFCCRNSVLSAASNQHIKYLNITEKQDQIQNTSGPRKTVSSWSIVMFLLVLFDFVSFAILGVWGPKLAWKLSDCSPGKMGAWTFSSLGWTAIQFCLSASALTTPLKLTKWFGYLLWPLISVVQFSKLKPLASKVKSLLPEAETQVTAWAFPFAWLRHRFSCRLWVVMAVSKSLREFGTRSLLLTPFEQLPSFIHSTATPLPQQCNPEVFPWYMSAKASGDICATLRTHGDLTMCSWSLHCFLRRKPQKLFLQFLLAGDWHVTRQLKSCCVNFIC